MFTAFPFLPVALTRGKEVIQIYRGCNKEVWLSSEEGSEQRLEEFANDGSPKKIKQLNNKSRSASNCSCTEGCLNPGVVRNAAKTSPSPRRAPCAPHCRRSDGRRDVNAEKGKMGREERRRNMKRARLAKTQMKARSCGPLKRPSNVNKMNRCFPRKDCCWFFLKKRILLFTRII